MSFGFLAPGRLSCLALGQTRCPARAKAGRAAAELAWRRAPESSVLRSVAKLRQSSPKPPTGLVVLGSLYGARKPKANEPGLRFRELHYDAGNANLVDWLNVFSQAPPCFLLSISLVFAIGSCPPKPRLVVLRLRGPVEAAEHDEGRRGFRRGLSELGDETQTELSSVIRQASSAAARRPSARAGHRLWPKGQRRQPTQGPAGAGRRDYPPPPRRAKDGERKLGFPPTRE